MSKRVKSGTGWFLGLLVAAALAVGARTAFASTSSCPFIPPHDVGSCANQAECAALCVYYNPGEDVTAVCNGLGCCHCYT
jgi:hypothetical protein